MSGPPPILAGGGTGGEPALFWLLVLFLLLSLFPRRSQWNEGIDLWRVTEGCATGYPRLVPLLGSAPARGGR